MEDELSKVLLKVVSEAGEPLETKEVEERAREFVEGGTRTKVYHRLSNLRGEGLIRGKFIGPGKGVWIWWKKEVSRSS
jgi:hypothetical protein